MMSLPETTHNKQAALGTGQSATGVHDLIDLGGRADENLDRVTLHAGDFAGERARSSGSSNEGRADAQWPSDIADDCLCQKPLG